jgi:transcriptional regulator with XRE-family HTH domain
MRIIRPGKGTERIGLSTLRIALKKSQQDVADTAGMSVREVERLESAEAPGATIATLRRYVEALGVELEVAAVINGRRARLFV